ncbi:MAG: hypothetical protein SR2Q5_06995 [Quinella sp. 2Q5]|nr:hypothetical protein [Quinella sp. 2Q5]
MALQENFYGLSEGVFKACRYAGLNFPPKNSSELQTSQAHVPSDYFGNNFDLSRAMVDKLCAEMKCTRNYLANLYQKFTEKFLSHKPIKHTKTDLNIYFCDYVLTSSKLGASVDNYFVFELYRKPIAIQRKFRMDRSGRLTRFVCNDKIARDVLNNKVKTNTLFNDFLQRDWLNTTDCTFEDFKAFVKKYPRFFSKPVESWQGQGAQIITVDATEDLEKLFATLRNDKRVLEEVIVQHETLRAFCPTAVNTIRVNTIFDAHNVVRILTTSGRFGTAGNVVDNLHGGGIAVVIDPNSGVITSNGITDTNERMSKHPDTGKTFKGFQYPAWDKVLALVKKLTPMLPQVRHVGWDITINDKGDAILVEGNGHYPGANVQQAPDDVGREHLYKPLIDELLNFNKMQVRVLGYRVNNLPDRALSYENCPLRQNVLVNMAMSKLLPDCKSLIDVGCRRGKFAKTACPAGVKYFPVDFKSYDAEIIACDFSAGAFPKVAADACLCVFSAEYAEILPQFLQNMCAAARKQILIMCSPFDKDFQLEYRWNNPFLTDFTEKFLLGVMKGNRFGLSAHYAVNAGVPIILYDFRKISAK